MTSKSRDWPQMFKEAKPLLAVIVLQFGYAGNALLSKYALNKGLSQHVFVVYRYTIAAAFMAPFAIVLERKVRPKMTLSIFLKIALLGLLEPALDQNLYYTAMKLTTATFATAMCNVLPAFSFFLAWVFRLENVNIKKLPSQIKILGTLVTIGGAMVMTLVKGALIKFPWTHVNQHYTSYSGSEHHKQEPVKGALLITAGCVCWSGFITLQAITLKTYPAQLSLTGLICFMGALEASIVAMVIERGNTSVWSVHFGMYLLAPLYSAIISSGFAYYIQGLIMQYKGPVFVSSFQPLSMVIVAIISSLFLSEVLTFGRILGAGIIVLGLYFFLWGKSRDQSPNRDGQEEIKAIDQEMTTKNPNTMAQDQENVVVSVQNGKARQHEEPI